MPNKLALSHLEPDPIIRSKRKRNRYHQKHDAEWARNEVLLGVITSDILDGLSRGDIIKKLKAGEYEGYRAYKDSFSHELYRVALAKIAINTDYTLDEKRQVAWSRYEKLYNEAMKSKNLAVARQVLNDMVKLFGLSQEAPTTAIQINNTEEGLQVNFGFSNPNNIIDVDAEEVKDED